MIIRPYTICAGIAHTDSVNGSHSLAISIEQDEGLLSEGEKDLLDRICAFWKDRRTSEIVNFTHEQKPWKMCRDGEYIPYSLIIQEDPTMFTHRIFNDNSLFTVEFGDYAKCLYLKRFEKEYIDKQWDIIVESIFQDLARIKTIDSDLQKTQQVDELWHKDNYWVLKYDFRVAQTKESTKSSGNRCIAFLDNATNKIIVLIIYGKGNLPKNIGEQAFIEQALNEEFHDCMLLVR